MINSIGKMFLILSLLSLTMVFSSGANAVAYYGAPPQTCFGSPGSGQAFIYTGQNYSGNCYLLQLDSYDDRWISWDATTGFPNDQIQSVWIGTDVTLVLFWNTFYTKDNGVPLHFGPYAYSGNLGSWNRQASAARLQRFPFGQCGTPGTLALFTDPNFNQGHLNDCTELVYSQYDGPVTMGFRNDTLSSVINNMNNTIALCSDVNYNGIWALVAPYSSIPALYFPFNDSMSSTTVAWY